MHAAKAVATGEDPQSMIGVGALRIIDDVVADAALARIALGILRARHRWIGAARHVLVGVEGSDGLLAEGNAGIVRIKQDGLGARRGGRPGHGRQH